MYLDLTIRVVYCIVYFADLFHVLKPIDESDAKWVCVPEIKKQTRHRSTQNEKNEILLYILLFTY